jgi:hypothetical protein
MSKIPDYDSCGKYFLYSDSTFVAGPKNNPETNPVGQWPWMASLGLYVERSEEQLLIEKNIEKNGNIEKNVSSDKIVWKHQCGATLISDQLFLTAAHCAQKTG